MREMLLYFLPRVIFYTSFAFLLIYGGLGLGSWSLDLVFGVYVFISVDTVCGLLGLLGFLVWGYLDSLSYCSLAISHKAF